jgi:hypothetical protein
VGVRPRQEPRRCDPPWPAPARKGGGKANTAAR